MVMCFLMFLGVVLPIRNPKKEDHSPGLGALRAKDLQELQVFAKVAGAEWDETSQ